MTQPSSGIMSDSISPCSIWSNEGQGGKTNFPYMDEMDDLSDGGFSPKPKHCKFCKETLKKITPNWFERGSTGKSLQNSTEECHSKLYTISERIFGLYCSENIDHSIQLKNMQSAMAQVSKDVPACKLKIFSLMDICPVVLKLCDETITFRLNLSTPPQLSTIAKFCEGIFDWLAKSDDNICFIYCNTDATILFTMAYAYSCYYDSLLRRDIKHSLEIKSFLNSNSKALEKVPVSYRRYAGYMSLYSCMHELHSFRTSANMYSLILFNFPAMESNSNKTSQLFFKIYTNEPLKCSHTTKLYCLPSNVNRLVILFDHYPILLRNDSMIICYHRSLIGNKRTKIFRINFHTCQVTTDIMTFYTQDFEDLYPGSSLKMKLDLHFQTTSTISQGEPNFVCDASLSNLSQLERYDSYQSLSGNAIRRTHSSLASTNCQSASSSITIFNTTTKEESKGKESSITKNEVLNNSGRITGPVDSYHSTKLESVRTSSTVLNGLSCNSTNNNSYQNNNYSEGEKCSKQLDTLMRDLNLGATNPTSTGSVTHQLNSNLYGQNCHTIQSNVTNNREVQLMTELLEAQKEISNLRRSMNHLDMVDHGREVSQVSKSNVFNSRSQGFSGDNWNSSTLDNRDIQSPRLRMWNSNQKDIDVFSKNDGPLKNSNKLIQQTYSKQDYNSLDGRATPSSYSAHRENMAKERQIKGRYETSEKVLNQKYHNEIESTDVLEEIETINLQPIGKGIHDLNKGSAVMKGPRPITPGESYRMDHGSHNFIDNTDSLSPTSFRQNFSMSKTDIGPQNIHQSKMSSPFRAGSSGFINEGSQNITLQLVEDRVQWWYQPNISRDEAIIILKNCTPGSFLIRDSNTYAGAYGLAVKVSAIPTKFVPKSDDLEAEKVRHYLIEPMGNQGVCFKGFPEEPVFPSLANLVLYYSHTASVLPCLLALPKQSLTEIQKISSKITSENSVLISSPKMQSHFADNKNGFSVYYLGCYDVEYITGPSVINKAIERLLSDIDARKFTECQLRINPNDGIVLTDMERKLFFRRHHSFVNITYCALDPRDRKIELDLCKSKGVKKTKLFGLIIKNYVAGESKCFLFGELDSSQKASTIVKAISDNLPKSTQLQ